MWRNMVVCGGSVMACLKSNNGVGEPQLDTATSSVLARGVQDKKDSKDGKDDEEKKDDEDGEGIYISYDAILHSLIIYHAINKFSYR
jgi:hypothetical protein